jgi:tetratricopeptide (TPR) repeat protein
MLAWLCLALNMNFVEAIQATLGELNDRFLSRSTDYDSPLTQWYCEALRAYLKGDAFQFLECKNNIPDLTGKEVLKNIAELRFEMMSGKVQQETINNLLEVSRSHSLYYGEALFTVALAYCQLHKNEEAFEIFAQAHDELLKIGASYKALKASLNRVSLLTRMNPKENGIAEFLHVAKKAKELKSRQIEGFCYLNTSRAYQLAKLNQSALHYTNLAVQALEAEAGSKDYFMALLHRGILYYEMKDLKNAKLELEKVLIAPFLEVKEGAKVLANLIAGKELYPVDEFLITPSLKKEVLEYKQKQNPVLGDHEFLLVKRLFNSPLSRYEIIEAIYPQNIPISSLENRLKNLLNRMRKKYPGLIKNKNGRYELTNKSLAEQILQLI